MSIMLVSDKLVFYFYENFIDRNVLDPMFSPFKSHTNGSAFYLSGHHQQMDWSQQKLKNYIVNKFCLAVHTIVIPIRTEYIRTR